MGRWDDGKRGTMLVTKRNRHECRQEIAKAQECETLRSLVSVIVIVKRNARRINLNVVFTLSSFVSSYLRSVEGEGRRRVDRS